MGFKVISAPGFIETPLGGNNYSVRPTLTVTRENASPDPGALGRKPIAWGDFGTAAAYGSVDCFGGWNASIPGTYGKWSVTYNGFGQPQYIQNYIFGVSTELFQAATSYDLGALFGSDVSVPITFFLSDNHVPTIPGATALIMWGRGVDEGTYGGYRTGELDASILWYKTRAEDAVLVALVPYQLGDTFISFNYPVNPMTQASVANVWIRWRKGTNNDTSFYDGQQAVAVGAAGKGPIRFDTTLNNLDPDQYYTFWVYVERNTSGLTSTVGPTQTWKTKPLGQVTFPSAGATITVSPSPTECKFTWTVPMVVTRLGFLPIPSSQVEVMLLTDYNLYGWDASRTIYSRLQPAEVPDVTRAGSNPTIDSSVLFNATTLAANAQQFVRGNGPVSQLKAHRDYVFRLRIDFKGAAVYPLSGNFSTPDYSVTRPEVSNQYTEGII